MLRYLTRRLLQMIPTVLGVILVTFILFHLVGGSPARMTLGEKASARALEEFDEQRGFNKPLFFGWNVRTRAFPDHDLNVSAGVWAPVQGVTYRPQENQGGLVTFNTTNVTRLPLAFAPMQGVTYEWRVTYLSPDGRGFTDGRFRFEAGGEHDVLNSIANASNEVTIAKLQLRRLVKNPFDSQFFFFLRQLIRLDFGVSSSTNQRVSRLLLDGMGPTLALAIPILLVELVVSIVLALLCAFFRGRLFDRLFVTIAIALMSVNYLVWIIAGQYLLGFRLGWFPVWGFASWHYLLLPVLIGVVSGLGADLRLYRTIMLDEVYKDYVRTAYAKGVSHVGVLFKHVLKNALIPVITNVVLALPFLYTGSLLLESFFGIPGLGYLGISAINSSDVDVVRALVVVGSISYLLANLLADLCYALVDPRVKWS